MHGHAETCSKIFQQHARVKTSRTNCREVRVHPRDERHRDLGAKRCAQCNGPPAAPRRPAVSPAVRRASASGTDMLMAGFIADAYYRIAHRPPATFTSCGPGSASSSGTSCAACRPPGGLAVTSTNPGFLDINLISPGNDFRRASVDAVLGALELAHDLEAGMVIVMPGRRHALSPAPDDACRWRLDQALEILLERAAALGVTIAARSTSSARPGPSAPSASTASPSTSSSTSNRRCRACTTTSPRSGSSGGPFRRPARSRASRRPERRRVTSPTEPRR